MACSLNGIIARENNEEDFLSFENWKSLVELASKAGALIWGRKTYEIVKSWKREYLESLDNVKRLIVSSDGGFQPAEGFLKANSPQDAVDILTKEGFDEAILSGGSRMNSSFAKEGLIDEIILNIDSVVIGKGIPLFSPGEFDLKLELLESKRIADDIIQLHYKVE